MKRNYIYLCMALSLIACLSTPALAQTAEEWYDRGYDCTFDGDYEGAVECYTKSIEADPSYVYAYDSRGLAHANLGQYDKAIADFTKAIEIDPEYQAPYSNLAFAYYRMGDFENALESFTVALEMDPAGTSYNARADVYRELGRYDEAIADIEEAMILVPNDPRWMYTRGLIYRDMGDTDRAKADLEHACTEGVPEACAALEDVM